jgi:hypothetical protein
MTGPTSLNWAPMEHLLAGRTGRWPHPGLPPVGAGFGGASSSGPPRAGTGASISDPSGQRTARRGLRTRRVLLQEGPHVRRQRNGDAGPRFARGEVKGAVGTVYVGPGEAGEVTQPLASMDGENHHPLPFVRPAEITDAPKAPGALRTRGLRLLFTGDNPRDPPGSDARGRWR